MNSDHHMPASQERLAKRLDALREEAIERNKTARHPKDIGAHDAIQLLSQTQYIRSGAALEIDLCIAYVLSGGNLIIEPDAAQLTTDLVFKLIKDENHPETRIFLPKELPALSWIIHTFRHEGKDYTSPVEQSCSTKDLLSSLDETMSFFSRHRPWGENSIQLKYRSSKEPPYHYYQWAVNFPEKGINFTSHEFQTPRLAAAHVLFAHFWPQHPNPQTR